MRRCISSQSLKEDEISFAKGSFLLSIHGQLAGGIPRCACRYSMSDVRRVILLVHDVRWHRSYFSSIVCTQMNGGTTYDIFSYGLTQVLIFTRPSFQTRWNTPPNLWCSWYNILHISLHFFTFQPVESLLVLCIQLVIQIDGLHVFSRYDMSSRNRFLSEGVSLDRSPMFTTKLDHQKFWSTRSCCRRLWRHQYFGTSKSEMTKTLMVAT